MFSITNADKFKITNNREAIDSNKNEGIGFCGKPNEDTFDLYISNKANKVDPKTGSGRSYALYASNYENSNYVKEN